MPNRIETTLVIYYTHPNRYSFNALVGAIEVDTELCNMDIHFPKNKTALIQHLRQLIQNNRRVILAFSFFTTQVWEIANLLQIIKEQFGERIVYLAGGPHPTGDPYGALSLGFNYVVIGEGEETLIAIIKSIENKQSILKIPGIAYLDESSELQITEKREPIDLNDYPPFAIKHERFGPIEITRGCPFVCFFCQTPYIFGSRVRHRSIENIVKYVEIMKEYSLTDIRFISPNAFSYGSTNGKTVNLAKLENMLNAVKDVLGDEGRIFIGSFPSEVRPEHVTEETLELVKRYGNNDNLILGAQSGSQRILDKCHRGHTVRDVYDAVKLILNANLKAYVDFIFGLPGETAEDIDLTIRMMDELSAWGARIHAHTFIPLPSTPFGQSPAGKISGDLKAKIQKLVSEGRIYGDWRKQAKVAKRITKEIQSKRW